MVERWAGLRPKAIGRDPMTGRHPNYPRLYTLTGGFKISFGLAHRLAASVIAEMAGRRGRIIAGFVPMQQPLFLVAGAVRVYVS